MFGYRKKNRERPIVGDRRPPSKLGDIQSDHWLVKYTTELINLLHVLRRLIELEPSQAALLERVCRPHDRRRRATCRRALAVLAGLARRSGAETDDYARLFD